MALGRVAWRDWKLMRLAYLPLTSGKLFNARRVRGRSPYALTWRPNSVTGVSDRVGNVACLDSDNRTFVSMGDGHLLRLFPLVALLPAFSHWKRGAKPGSAAPSPGPEAAMVTAAKHFSGAHNVLL
ncbi:hypothetical protein BHM03_00013706 [Ensete ventricosum]|nr:hypothetical protein BHM03_00013706 [Ensete ventricosum]